MKLAACTYVLVMGTVLWAAAPLRAQWPAYPLPGAPRTADGRPDLNAPTPRTPDGRPDLSGVWETVSGRSGGPRVAAAGTGELPPSGSIFGNIGDGIPGGAPYQPWAAELVKKRMADNSKDNPDAHCLPLGIMQNTSHPFPKKIIQTPLEVIMIYEGSATTVREIFLDGRRPDADAAAVVQRLLDRPLGRRHAGRRDDQLPRRRHLDDLARCAREPADATAAS